MARPRSHDDETVLAGLMRAFTEVGYEGATLAILSRATGLQKASLYHRFPGGKEQMAREVLASTSVWLEANVLEPLTSDGPTHERIATVADNLDRFYRHGEQACLLNMLSSPRLDESPFGAGIRQAFETLIDAFAQFYRDCGEHDADTRTRETLALLQGSLVLSRGLGSTGPFADFLVRLRSSATRQPEPTA